MKDKHNPILGTKRRSTIQDTWHLLTSLIKTSIKLYTARTKQILAILDGWTLVVKNEKDKAWIN